MKRFMLISLLAFVAFALSAQTRIVGNTADGSISKESYVYLWGTTADTLTDVDTALFELRTYGLETQDFVIKLYNDHVSGTAGGVLTVTASIDGSTYDSTLGTITVSSLAADALDSEVIGLSDFCYPYIKFNYIQSGTAVTVPKLYIYTKPN